MTDHDGAPTISRQRVVIACGSSYEPAPGGLDDAFVVVRAGTVELACSLGGRRRFGPGSMLGLAGITVVEVRNVGACAVELAVVRRQVRAAVPEGPRPGRP